MQPQAVRTLWWLGETQGFWIQTGALFLSALGALWIVFSRSRTERKRATVDLVLQQKQDKELMEAKKKILELHEEHQEDFIRFLQDKKSLEYDTIIKILNMHEFIAAGIREGAYDERLYKRMQYSTTIRDWEALNGFIAEFRRRIKRSTLWQEFEWLAKRWQKDPLTTN